MKGPVMRGIVPSDARRPVPAGDRLLMSRLAAQDANRTARAEHG